MSKPPRFVDRKSLTLQGERTNIADAHVFADRKDRSISWLFWNWFLPKVAADKQKCPEAYGDHPQPAATKGGK